MRPLRGEPAKVGDDARGELAPGGSLIGLGGIVPPPLDWRHARHLPLYGTSQGVVNLSGRPNPLLLAGPGRHRSSIVGESVGPNHGSTSRYSLRRTPQRANLRRD